MKPQNYFMEKKLLLKLKKLQENTFEAKGLGIDLPEIKIRSNEIKKRN